MLSSRSSGGGGAILRWLLLPTLLLLIFVLSFNFEHDSGTMPTGIGLCSCRLRRRKRI